MDIVSGLAGLKAAADLTRILRDAAKTGAIKPDEFAGRVGEIYDYIIDSRAALLQAQEEVLELRAEIEAFNDDGEFRKSLTFDREGSYHRDGPQGRELYCSACLDSDRKRVRLRTDSEGSHHCHVHGYRQG